jgi:hypothetical protein
MNDMDKLKKLQMVAKVLREHHGYKGNKESDHSNRFNFKFDKSEGIASPCIDVYNAEKGANLFLWPEIIELCHGFGLSHYIHYDKYDLKEVVLHIY